MSKNIFIVDDDEIFVFTLVSSLEFQGISANIEIFNNGKEAYDELESRKKTDLPLPDVILLDLNMPVWDGFTFLDNVKALELPKSLRIRVLTSSTSQTDMNKVYEYSIVTEYLSKPVPMEGLEKLLS